MATDPNFSFLARQLALSDFPSAIIEDLDGGCLCSQQSLWVATWDPTAIIDPDNQVEEVLTRAGDAGIAKWLLISPMQASNLPEGVAIAESLFLGGFSKMEFSESGDPDNIQVIGKPEFKPVPKGVTLESVPPGDQRLFDLISSSSGADEHLGFDLGGLTESPLDELDFIVASSEGLPVGSVAWRTSGAICRIAWIWVAPDHRSTGIGQSLVAAAVEFAGSSGAVVQTVWTGLKGTLRYFFSRLGFEDQLRVSTFRPD